MVEIDKDGVFIEGWMIGNDFDWRRYLLASARDDYMRLIKIL